ncbi:MAG: dienelactone hydrolase family protein [Acidimicrobiia bacterium]
MGEMIEFASNGDQAKGYLATPAHTPAPGLLVLQEWWGLVPQITRTCDRFAAEGFVALAPDLYHGAIAEHTEMDKAAELMNTMPPERAARDMGAAVDHLLANPLVSGDSIGVVGFGMGGLLTLVVAAQQGDKVGAAVPFYGAPLGDSAPDWAGLTAPVLGHYAGDDGFFPSDACMALGEELNDAGKDATFVLYPGMGHAFANEEDPLGNYDRDVAAQAWARTIDFLHSKLG